MTNAADDSAIPPPPPGLELSPVPDKTVDAGAEWISKLLNREVKPRYLESNTDDGELKCHVIAAKRMYSTAELYRFIMTRPGTTKMKKRKPAAAPQTQPPGLGTPWGA